MKDGYPTEEELARIENWPIKCREDCLKLTEFIVSLWYYPDYAILDGNKLELHTGGWSGNESIIAAMQQNKAFWAICWVKSERGGHCEFEVKK